MAAGTYEAKPGVPGNANWSSTSPLMVSAPAATRLPAGVAGPVVIIVFMAMNPTGRPASAYTSAASRPWSSCPNGSMQQMSAENGGRWRKVSRSPLRARAISTA